MQEVVKTPEQDYRIRDYGFDDSAYTDQILLSSEKLLNKYLEGEMAGEEELTAAARFRAGKGRLYPVYVCLLYTSRCV